MFYIYHVYITTRAALGMEGRNGKKKTMRLIEICRLHLRESRIGGDRSCHLVTLIGIEASKKNLVVCSSVVVVWSEGMRERG